MPEAPLVPTRWIDWMEASSVNWCASCGHSSNAHTPFWSTGKRRVARVADGVEGEHQVVDVVRCQEDAVGRAASARVRLGFGDAAEQAQVDVPAVGQAERDEQDVVVAQLVGDPARSADVLLPSGHDLSGGVVGRDGDALGAGDGLGLPVLLTLARAVACGQLVLTIGEQDERLAGRAARRGAVVDQLIAGSSECGPVVGLEPGVAVGEVGHGRRCGRQGVGVEGCPVGRRPDVGCEATDGDVDRAAGPCGRVGEPAQQQLGRGDASVVRVGPPQAPALVDEEQDVGVTGLAQAGAEVLQRRSARRRRCRERGASGAEGRGDDSGAEGQEHERRPEPGDRPDGRATVAAHEANIGSRANQSANSHACAAAARSASTSAVPRSARTRPSRRR